MVENISILALEKNFCVLQRKQTEFFFNEIYSNDELKDEIYTEYNYPKNINYPNINPLNIRSDEFENLNFLTTSSKSVNLSYNQQLLENCINDIDFVYGKNNYLTADFNDLTTIRRRKRRKFASEEERRVARILKNRRTAEESRQRRIQRMRTLENFVSISEERERKFKEEIRLIALQSAFRMVELILRRKLPSIYFH